MRTLPESASLDHLRRQAKDLLAVLRRSRPSATLADAQASVAREYGYESWAQLKAAAEQQRAASTEIAAIELVEALVDRYGLGHATGAMRRVERTWAGHLWELEASAGRVVFTELFDYVKPEDIELEAGFVERAIAGGISAPAPIRTTVGAVVAPLNGTNWRAHRWVRLGPAPTKPPSPRTAAAAGRGLAVLHSLALPAPRPVARWLNVPTPRAGVARPGRSSSPRRRRLGRRARRGGAGHDRPDLRRRRAAQARGPQSAGPAGGPDLATEDRAPRRDAP